MQKLGESKRGKGDVVGFCKVVALYSVSEWEMTTRKERKERKERGISLLSSQQL